VGDFTQILDVAMERLESKLEQRSQQDSTNAVNMLAEKIASSQAALESRVTTQIQGVNDKLDAMMALLGSGTAAAAGTSHVIRDALRQ
jgi:hypothetical protein